MQIEKKIQFHFKLSTEDGTIEDNSYTSNLPISITLGKNQLVPNKLEDYLKGSTAGDKFEVTLSPEEAYGLRKESRVIVVPITDIRLSEENESVENGDLVQVCKENKEGEIEEIPFKYRVTGLLNGMVALDGNHPLAGKSLNYEMEVLSVEEVEINQDQNEDIS